MRRYMRRYMRAYMRMRAHCIRPGVVSKAPQIKGQTASGVFLPGDLACLREAAAEHPWTR
jgi:hypothetical protein